MNQCNNILTRANISIEDSEQQGTIYEETSIVNRITRGLPKEESWQRIKSILAERPAQVRTKDYVIASLIQHAGSVQQHEEQVTMNTFMPKSAKPRKTSNEVICYKCHNRGHFAKECGLRCTT